MGEGAGEAGDPRELAKRSDVIITMVTDSPDVEEVLLGPSGVIAAARPGLVVIDMSTISPAVTRRIAGELGAVGVDMLDAPVSGGEQGAEGGTLSIMVGGSEETFRLCRPLLEVLGTKIVHCGGSGAGQTVKLCNQIVVGLNNLAMCEALLFACRMGVSPATVMDVVAAGAGNSWAIRNLAPKILQRDFRPGFKVVDQQKDLRLILDAAGSKRLPLPRHGAGSTAVCSGGGGRFPRRWDPSAHQGAGEYGWHGGRPPVDDGWTACQGARRPSP